MNCPQCEQPIGQDHPTIGPWKHEHDARHRVIGSSRSIWIHCDHCGYFTAEQDGRNFIRRVTHHVSPQDIHRVAREMHRATQKVPA